MKKDTNNNLYITREPKKRIRYPRNFKRELLLASNDNKNLLDIFKSYHYDIDSFLKTDKKYISKLIYKWRKELYRKRDLYFIAYDKMEYKKHIKGVVDCREENTFNPFIRHYKRVQFDTEKMEEKMKMKRQNYKPSKKRVKLTVMDIC